MQGRATASRRGVRKLVVALEAGLVGQDREAGRAAGLVGPGQGRRIEVGADQALATARPS